MLRESEHWLPNHRGDNSTGSEHHRKSYNIAVSLSKAGWQCLDLGQWLIGRSCNQGRREVVLEYGIPDDDEPADHADLAGDTPAEHHDRRSNHHDRPDYDDPGHHDDDHKYMRKCMYC